MIWNSIQVMSLNAVFVVFMDFDIFRNVGLLHQGLESVFTGE